MLQRPGEQELIQQLALASRTPRPAQPGQHLGAMIATCAALPAAVGRQQPRRVGRFQAQREREASPGQFRATDQIVRNPAQPRQRAQLHRDTEPVLITVEPAHPAEIIAVRVKKVTASSAAITAGQMDRRASSGSDR
jgi:hypothetical protein